MGKILIGMICDGKAGGIDKYLLNFYETVKKQNHTIDFLTNNKDDELEHYLNKNNSRIFEVPSLMHPVKQYQEVKNIIQAGGYDTVYMNISTALTFPALKAAHDCKVEKVIVHSHSVSVDEEMVLKRVIFKCLHNICKGIICRCANKYLACSDEAAEWMFTQDIIRNKKYEVIFNAINTEQFCFDEEARNRLRAELGIKDEFVIGNVGNMSYPKNQLFLIDVFHELLKREPDAKMVMIGDGILMPAIEEKVASYGIQNSVKLLGRVDVSKGYMNVFDVFALPSRFEGLGIVLIEAQCTKIPCVASIKVPKLAKVSNMLTFLPFEKEEWVETLLSYKNCNKDTFVFDSMEKFSLSHQEKILNSIVSE